MTEMVEVDKQMPKRMLLIIRLEEHAVPADAVETHETLCWWNVDQTSLTKRLTPIGPECLDTRCRERAQYESECSSTSPGPEPV
jgi:hypothetical protein